MAFPDVNLIELCIPTKEMPDLRIPFPGGMALRPSTGIDSGDLLEMTRSLLGPAAAATAPFQPIFDMIKTIQAIIDCVQAIPDAFGPPPDPTGLINCIPNLLEQLQKLLALVPPLSVIPTIKGLVLAIVTTLEGIVLELEAVAKQIQRLAESTALASQPGNEELQIVVACEGDNVAMKMQNLQASMGPVGEVLSALNTLLELAQLEPIASLDAIGPDPTEAIAKIRTGIDVIKAVLQYLPG